MGPYLCVAVISHMSAKDIAASRYIFDSLVFVDIRGLREDSMTMSNRSNNATFSIWACSALFHILFYVVTFMFAVLCTVLAFVPGRKAIMGGLWLYTRTIKWLLEVICDIRVSVRGKDKLPKSGAYIIAAKHQSYGDGIMMFSQMFDLTFVADNHLEKIILLRRILAKMGAVMVDNCGGADAREKLTREADRVREDQRRLLIYPEGHLSKIGTQHRYRKGVYFMQQDFDCPVIPVATNLGQRWNQQDFLKFPGEAVLEFLDPIAPGMGKDEFMARLENDIETRSIAMLDLQNLGALDPSDIGQIQENDRAREKRMAKEAREDGGGKTQS